MWERVRDVTEIQKERKKGRKLERRRERRVLNTADVYHSRWCVNWRHYTDRSVKDFKVHLVLHLRPSTRTRHGHYRDTYKVTADVSVQCDDITEVGLHKRTLKETGIKK